MRMLPAARKAKPNTESLANVRDEASGAKVGVRSELVGQPRAVGGCNV